MFEEQYYWAVRGEYGDWIGEELNASYPGIGWVDNKRERTVFLATRPIAYAFLNYVNSIAPTFPAKLVRINRKWDRWTK